MTTPDTAKSRIPYKTLTTLGLLALAAFVLSACEQPISVDDDISATLPIGDETHHPSWVQMMWTGKVAVPITHPAYDTFTFNIEGHNETIRVPSDVAGKYQPGDKVEVSYDRQHYKDGHVYITDVKLK